MIEAPEREFHAVVARVEERFRSAYDAERLGNAKTEGQGTPDKVSTGWWVVLAQFGVAMRFGADKPDIEAGDTLVLIARRLPKEKPSAPLAVVPDSPPPDFTPAELAIIRRFATTYPDPAEAAAIVAKIKEPADG